MFDEMPGVLSILRKFRKYRRIEGGGQNSAGIYEDKACKAYNDSMRRAERILDAWDKPPKTVAEFQKRTAVMLHAFTLTGTDQYDQLVVQVPQGRMVFDLSAEEQDLRVAWAAVLMLAEGTTWA